MKQLHFIQKQSNIFLKRSRNIPKITLAFVFFLSFTNFSNSQIVVDCAAGHLNTTYCYVDNDTTQFVFTNPDGLPLNLFFNAGQVENNFDELIVLDTDGVTNLNAGSPYGNNGNLTGLSFQSSGDTITVMIDSDSVISCATNAFTPWDFDIWCQTCLNPTVDFDTSECEEGVDFSIFVDVIDLGTATTLSITDDQGSAEQLTTTTGIITFGPYSQETIVVITVSNADDVNCIITSDPISCLSGIFTIDESYSTQELIEDILFDGGCVELSNFSQSTGTDFGDVNGIAAFQANGSNFPFQDGIVLTSGNAQGVPGPNLDLNSEGGIDWPGDADLEANTTATATNNASYIQFDFVPLLDQISFNFLLASEEYNQNFECTYSDAFAFILTDLNTGVVQNLAVLPGTNIPIEVTNIHPDVPGQCSAVNEEYFDKYNFSPFNPEDEAVIDYNGQIVSLQAIGDVISGNPYTIKLVIADETDTAYDSAVFIEAGSFDIGNVDLGNDILTEDGTAICEGESIILDAGNSAEATYQWFKDDIEITGETNSTLEVTETGLYRVDVQFILAPDCTASDEILVEFFIEPIIDLGEDFLTCFEEGTQLDASPTNMNPNDATYEWSLDGNILAGEILPILIITETGTYSVIVTAGSCPVAEDSITVSSINDLGVDLGEDITTCLVSLIILDASPTNMDPADATYEWSLDGVVILGETLPLLNTTEFGTYSVIVTAGNCFTEDTITITPSNILGVELGDDFVTCFSSPVFLDATPTIGDPADATYEWSLDGTVLPDTTATIDATQHGTYTVIVAFGVCEDIDSIELIPLNDLGVNLGNDIETCFEDIIVLNATPTVDPANATYQWSLNGEIISDETSSGIVVTEYGVYSVIVALGGDCSQEESITVSGRDDLIVSLGDDIMSCKDMPVVLTASTNESNVTYQWRDHNDDIILGETGSSLNVPEDSEGEFISGTYSVTITTGECTGTDSVDVSYYDNEGCVISQGLSPHNGDGLNDYLDLSFLDDRSGIVSFQVFNRLGTLVYNRTSYRKEWTGQSNADKILPTGTYYYIINFRNEDPVYGNETSGWVYVNREEN